MKMLCKRFYATAIAMTFLIGLSSFFQPADLVYDVFHETNAFRHSQGLPALVLRQDLCNIAAQHSADMAAGRVAFGHNGFDDRFDMARNMMPSLRSFAENVAYGVTMGAEVVNMWKHSAGHRRNMMGDFQYIGIGVAKDSNGRIYYTQIFGG